MPLTNKYLKYSPEITLEIFTLVWDKLIDCGWKPYSNQKLENIWTYLTKESWLGIRSKNGNKFLQYKNDPLTNLTETTVQEILGYDPFVKEDFVLPEKWYVSVTNETVEDINIFKSKTCWKDKAIDYKTVSYEGVGYNRPPNDCTEITFDQFKKYVLKSAEESKEVIPEYVECIGLLESKVKGWSNYYTIGKIYKNNFTNNDKFIYVIGDDGEEWACEISQFKPSTKEAFDAQNKPKQPLKQAVHCKTQEEYKFAKETLGAIFNSNAYIKDESIIPLDAIDCTITLNRFGHSIYNGYQLLSFQEWCDLNRYKMEKEMILDESHIGKLISLTYNNRFYDEVLITKEYGIGIYLLNNVRSNNDGHPNKSVYKYSLYFNDFQEANRLIKDIKFLDKPVERQSNQEFKVGDWVIITANTNDSCNRIGDIGQISESSSTYDARVSVKGRGNIGNFTNFKEMRHATPEEINSHLISIGQIPAGEPLNIGIEPNKDGMFKYKTVPGTSWSSGTIQNHLEAMIPTTGNCYNKDFATSYIPIKPKMILSIDNEELPMVQIKQTNTIKQLLNN